MPDSRYAIENVEWDGRNDARIKPGPKQVLLQVTPGDSSYDAWQGFQLCVPATAYEELLEVAEDMARFIEWTENNRGYLAVRVMPNDIQDAGQKALANFRASSSTPTRTRNEK